MVVLSVMIGGGGGDGWVADDGVTELVWLPMFSSAQHNGVPFESTMMHSVATKIISLS